MVLVVRSDDPAILLRLAELAHEDVDDAQVATKLLLEEERLTVVAWPTLRFTDAEPATFVMGRKIPHMTGSTVNESGQPVVAFERVDHEQVRIEAAVDETTAIVEGIVKIDDVEPHPQLVDGLLVPPDYSREGDDALHRSFHVARDGDAVALILDGETLLVGIAATAELGLPSPYVVPSLPESPRARRQLLDGLLLDRP
jgi:hypothetical protein